MSLYPYKNVDCEDGVYKIPRGEEFKCETCGKYVTCGGETYTHYFPTLDGGDFLDYTECNECIKTK